jgi:hypothetical protein
MNSFQHATNPTKYLTQRREGAKSGIEPQSTKDTKKAIMKKNPLQSSFVIFVFLVVNKNVETSSLRLRAFA